MKDLQELTYTVPEMAKVLKIGLNNAYELVHRKGFPVIHIGKKKIIPKEALNKWLETAVEAI